MKSSFASALLLIALAGTILPPGYPAYVGSYVALGACLLSFFFFGWRERSGLCHPISLAIFAAIALVGLSVPFVYRSPQDVLAPVLLLPMLSTIALGLLARPARFVPGSTVFASICLVASCVAIVAGAYESAVLGVYRSGLGNNPIHYASLAAMAGGLALVGVVGTQSAWRYVFLLGPAFGLGSAIIADSRGPMLGAGTIAAAGLFLLTIWLWRETLFRHLMLGALLISGAVGTLLFGSGNSRVAGIFHSALNIFRFTGGSDDIRALLYTSALEVLRRSPVVGGGLGQIMHTAQELFPNRPEPFWLEDLHADWANFAAMAGGLGLLAWLLLLVAPLLLLVDKRSRQDRPIVLGVLVLSIGQLVLGISNATFGILPQTMIYAVALGYFLVRARCLAE